MDENLLKKLRNAQTSEDIIKMAREEHIELGQEEAKEIFDKFHATGELNDDEIEAVSGGGCHKNLDFNFNPNTNKYYTGRVISLKNDGHCRGASASYKPSRFCLKPGCGSSTFYIIKEVDDQGTYLIGCNKCDWTYWVKKENIV